MSKKLVEFFNDHPEVPPLTAVLLYKLATGEHLTSRDIYDARLSDERTEVVKAVAGGHPDTTRDALKWAEEEAKLALWREYNVLTDYTEKYAKGGAVWHDQGLED